MKDHSKIHHLAHNVQELVDSSSPRPETLLAGAVFFDMKSLCWIKVSGLNSTWAHISVGPRVGCDRSMPVDMANEVYLDAVGESLLYFPPGRAAAAAIRQIKNLPRPE